MAKKFFKVNDRQTLESLISDSRTKPVIIFKHSNTCGVSSSAYRELEKLDDQVNLVEVQSARDISRELASLTGVEHETPQVIILRNGKAVWNISHFGIRAAEVMKAVQSYT